MKKQNDKVKEESPFNIRRVDKDGNIGEELTGKERERALEKVALEAIEKLREKDEEIVQLKETVAKHKQELADSIRVLNFYKRHAEQLEKEKPNELTQYLKVVIAVAVCFMVFVCGVMAALKILS